MPTARFLIQRRDQGVDEVSIESDGLTIGRSPGNELVLNHRAVHETYAGIKEIEGRYWVFNLSGKNGIVVNGHLVERAQIAESDLLQAGPYLLRSPKGMISGIQLNRSGGMSNSGVSSAKRQTGRER